MTIFSTRLKSLRLEKKWSQTELSRRTGLDQGYISRLETDMFVSPGIKTLTKLADALGTSIDYLVGR